uniref:Uncharacterized protein n=2 Tax=Cucumis sativus TaxID=3659 RepID=A0A0A0LF72_CUCSA
MIILDTDRCLLTSPLLCSSVVALPQHRRRFRRGLLARFEKATCSQAPVSFIFILNALCFRLLILLHLPINQLIEEFWNPLKSKALGMDPKHTGEILKHLEKQGEFLMDAYRSMSHELHKLQVEEEMLMRKFYEIMSAHGLVKKNEDDRNSSGSARNGDNNIE